MWYKHRKYIFKQIALKQASLSNAIFKEESVINLLLKVSGGAILSEKNFLFPYDIFIFSADSKCWSSVLLSKYTSAILKKYKFLILLLLLVQLQPEKSMYVIFQTANLVSYGLHKCICNIRVYLYFIKYHSTVKLDSYNMWRRDWGKRYSMTAVHKVTEYVSSHIIRGPVHTLSLPMMLTSTPMHVIGQERNMCQRHLTAEIPTLC